MNADRIFALGGGAVLVVVGLVILGQVSLAIWRPAWMYEAAATVALSSDRPTTVEEDEQTAWSLLPSSAPVSFEPLPGQPHVYHLSTRSPEPKQAVAEVNAAAAAMQTNAAHVAGAHVQIVHPAGNAVEWMSPHGMRSFIGASLLLLLALGPIYFGLRMILRRPSNFPAPSIP